MGVRGRIGSKRGNKCIKYIMMFLQVRNGAQRIAEEAKNTHRNMQASASSALTLGGGGRFFAACAAADSWFGCIIASGCLPGVPGSPSLTTGLPTCTIEWHPPIFG